MSDQKKLILAILASLAFYFTLEYFYPRKIDVPVVVSSKINDTSNTKASVGTSTIEKQTINNSKEEDIFTANTSLTYEEALNQDERVEIETPQIKGSLRLKGAVLDDVRLLSYAQTIEKDSLPVVLLSPLGAKNAYVTTFLYDGKKDGPGDIQDKVGLNTVWQVASESKKLTPTTPLILKAKITNNLQIKRTITVDDTYLFTVKDEISNTGKHPIVLKPISAITRVGTPSVGGFFVLHEGGVGVMKDSVAEVSYADIAKKGKIEESTKGGWIGFTDKYWLSALIPNKTQNTITSFTSTQDVYQSTVVGETLKIEPGSTVEQSQDLFVGAKVLRILDAYQDNRGIDRFDKAVDFGWFYFLTKPLFYVLEAFNSFFGNMGFAILLLTILFKIMVFPLANKSHRSMARMKTLQPKMEKIKQLYGNDKVRLNQEMLELYKKEKVNPVSGCLPMLIQAPIFFCLYKVFFVTIEMRHAPFIGWIHDLSVPDPTSLFNLFGLIPWAPPSFLAIGAWPLIMGATMVLQQRMGPQPADPQQAKVMMIMPIMFTFMFASFPAGLVIYWAWSNVLTIFQQLYINGRLASNMMGRSNPGTKSK